LAALLKEPPYHHHLIPCRNNNGRQTIYPSSWICNSFHPTTGCCAISCKFNFLPHISAHLARHSVRIDIESLSILLICIWQRRWRCLHCSSAMQNSFPLSFNYTVIVLGEASSPSAFHQIAIIYESNICQVSQQIHCILQKLISFL